jgi:hypothetical protein
MQDQTKPGDAAAEFDVAAEFDMAERSVLELLLDPDVPGPWSVHELGVALGSEVRAADAIMALHAAGLVHRLDEFVFATRAAARGMELAEPL